MERKKMDNYNAKKICVLGAGTMGTQIALYCSVYGYHVFLHSRTENGKRNAKKKIVDYIELMQANQKIKEEDIRFIFERIRVVSNFDKAVADADIVIESVVEDIQVKKDLFLKISDKCREDAIILTNSSSFIPSVFAEAVKKPERFCALHFYSLIWNTRIVDVMTHSKTSDKIKESVIAFTETLNLRPVVLKCESSNYVFNALFNEVLIKAIQLVLDEVADIEDIDVSWKRVLNVTKGPFGTMDVIGLDTVYKIIEQGSVKDTLRKEDVSRYLDFVKKFIDEGRLGIKSGKGFYNYE